MEAVKLKPGWLPSVRKILKIYGVASTKHLSQNFIFDTNLTDRIAQFLGPSVDNNLVIEIGPGPGSLTRSILKRNPKAVFGIEKDVRFEPILQQLQDSQPDKFRFCMRNALLQESYDEIHNAMAQELTDGRIEKIQIIGNLPFNVATPMHIQWLRWINEKTSNLFKYSMPVEMILMFQKEVAERIVAQPGSDCFGRLAVISQLYCNVQYLTTVQSRYFTPQPQVSAGLVRLVGKAEQLQWLDFCHVETLTNILFRHPNKTIQNNLRIKLGDETFGQIKESIPEAVLRCTPRTLSLEQFMQVGTVMKPILPLVKL